MIDERVVVSAHFRSLKSRVESALVGTVAFVAFCIVASHLFHRWEVGVLLALAVVIELARRWQ